MKVRATDNARAGYRYLRFPQALVFQPEYAALSSDAKILYTVLLSLTELSEKNGWRDKEGKVYVICTVRKTMELLHCASGKAVKVLRELDDESGASLIHRVRRGQGNPDRIYVRLPVDELYYERISHGLSSEDEVIIG